MDAYKVLGLKKGESPSKDFIWTTPEERLAFKILSDRRYKLLYDQAQSLNELFKAGFFDDGLKELPFNLNLLTTPTNKLKGKKGIILVSTGSFAPVHKGHLDMMEVAKASLEEQGHEVLGGYLSPSHDVYVQSKGDSLPFIDERLYTLQKELEDHPWLMVDPWEGRWVKSSINFTDVIDRLVLYLKNQGIDATPCYVFGSDNQDFKLAFSDEEFCVCVQRKHQEQKHEFRGNHTWIPQGKYLHYSSTFVREKKKAETPLEPEGIYLIRDDRSYENIGDDVFYKELLEEFKKSLGHKVKIFSLDLEEQKKLIQEITSPFINLDRCTDKGIKLEVCRNFFIADAQFSSKELQARPTFPELSLQIKNIPSGSFIIVDDDVASGTTIKFLKTLLPEGVTTTDVLALSKKAWENHPELKDLPYEFLDIVDFRDFLVGAKDGGLVVEGKFRVPYMLPYVSLTSRAKIPPKNTYEFSKALWAMNAKYYKRNPKKLSSADPSFRKLMEEIGFDSQSELEYICLWHLQKFY